MAEPNTSTLSFQRANELLRYDPDSGKLFWKVSTGRKAAGSEAGCKSKRFGGRGFCLVVGVGGRMYLAHRLAWLLQTGDWPEFEIDHIDGDALNNRWENLRDVPSFENKKNMPLYRTSTSGVAGVRWKTDAGKWVARININGKTVHLGYYGSKEDAVRARKFAEAEHGFHRNHGRRPS